MFNEHPPPPLSCLCSVNESRSWSIILGGFASSNETGKNNNWGTDITKHARICGGATNIGFRQNKHVMVGLRNV